MADAFDVKRPEIHAKPFLWKYSGDGLVCFVFNKEKIIASHCKASYSKHYSNQKIKD
jgi:hypothetical protein